MNRRDITKISVRQLVVWKDMCGCIAYMCASNILKQCYRCIVVITGVFLQLFCHAAEVDVGFTHNFLIQGGVDHPMLVINVGDTVKWTVLDSSQPAGVTRSYDGTWDSGMLRNIGDSFSYTFTNAGIFAYRTYSWDAAVLVERWTNEPPAITINDPVDGLRLPSGIMGVRLLAAVGIQETNVASVTFHWGTNIAATIADPPYAFTWPNPTNEDVTLLAELIRRDGTTVLSRPAHFSIGGTGAVYYPHVLAGGQMLTFYTSKPIPTQAQVFLEYKEALTNMEWSAVGIIAAGYGVAVDTNAMAQAQRFYRVAWNTLAP